jgi:hypothetical protein
MPFKGAIDLDVERELAAALARDEREITRSGCGRRTDPGQRMGAVPVPRRIDREEQP